MPHEDHGVSKKLNTSFLWTGKTMVAPLCQEFLWPWSPSAAEGAECCCAMPEQPPHPGEVLASPLPSRSLCWLWKQLCASTKPFLLSPSPSSGCCGRAGKKLSVVSPAHQPPPVTTAGQAHPGIPRRLLPTGAGLCSGCPFPGRAELALTATLKGLVRGWTGHQGAGVPLLSAAGPWAPLGPRELALCLGLVLLLPGWPCLGRQGRSLTFRLWGRSQSLFCIPEGIAGMILDGFGGSCRSRCVSIAGHVSQWGWVPGWTLMNFLMLRIAACGGNDCGTSPLCPTAGDYGFCKNIIVSPIWCESANKTRCYRERFRWTYAITSPRSMTVKFTLP